MNGSTSFEDRLRAEFQENPVGVRVVLPDETLAIVRKFEDRPEGRFFRVQSYEGHRYGPTNPRWFAGRELAIRYYIASVNPDWSPSA